MNFDWENFLTTLFATGFGAWGAYCFNLKQARNQEKEIEKSKLLKLFYDVNILTKTYVYHHENCVAQINNLTKIYGEKKAVDNLSLHIKAGEMYAFIGHNGAGKTTTIKSVCGLLNFEAGEILIDGISIKENPIECKRKISYCYKKC